MPDESFHHLGHLGGAEVGVQPTLDGQDILIRQSDLGQRLACLLAFGKADIIRREGAYYWRIIHNRQVDDLLIELIDLLITIRYAHPAMIQLELALSASEGIILEPAKP
jgi:hypothetical protein